MKNKGVSLIVLSITILVMAILAATAIIALEDSGIIGRSKNTVSKQNYQNEYTRLQVIKNGILTDNLGTITVEEYITALRNNDILDAGQTTNSDGSITVTTKNGIKVKLKANGKEDIGITVSSKVDAYESVFDCNTWEQIADACKKNKVPDTWKIGDIKTMTINGKSINVMIIGKNHDRYADGSGVAPLTFQTGVIENGMMNSAGTNVGGWSNSELYSYINNTLFNTMEYGRFVKPVIKTTNKGYVDSGYTNATEIITSYDKLFILSKIEVLGVDKTELLNREGSQYEYYASEGSTLQNYDGPTMNAGWLRTPHPFNANYYLIVYKNDGDSMLANNPTGISVGFCF